jgi:hypothetical protein
LNTLTLFKENEEVFEKADTNAANSCTGWHWNTFLLLFGEMCLFVRLSLCQVLNTFSFALKTLGLLDPHDICVKQIALLPDLYWSIIWYYGSVFTALRKIGNNLHVERRKMLQETVTCTVHDK